MPDGGSVTLGVAPADGDEPSTNLVVRDTGPGIGQEEVDRIFNPFFTTRSAGTGLGLAIVHRIIDAHGGAITVHNDDGAVFRMRIPLKAEGGTRNTDGSRDNRNAAPVAGRHSPLTTHHSPTS
jgi:signal transduction histidine kinase